MPTGAAHSWSGPRLHFHHHRLPPRAITSAGERLPFLVGCHSGTNSGCCAAIELVTDTRWFRQNGQLFPPYTCACHSWSGPFLHFHQTLWWLPLGTSRGVRSPFLLGCHKRATSGDRVASELVTETRFAAQKGQPVLVRIAIIAIHSWSGPSGHFHHTFRLAPAVN